MIPSLQKVDPTFCHEMADAVLLGETPRPSARRKVLERLRLANAIEGVTQDRLHEVDGAKGDSSVVFDPVPKIFNELRVKDRGGS